LDYADIYNTKALVELSGTDIGIEPEPSLGTHFFQDLLEGEIFPLSTHIGEDIFNHDFFVNTSNHAGEWLHNENIESLKLIRVGDFKPNFHIELIMDGDSGQALAFLVPNKQGVNEYNQ